MGTQIQQIFRIKDTNTSWLLW